uniref:Repeat domain-containing protein n=1 Tax=Candidatus Kentrum sp. TC TaxID=2126339 RepID=A0A450Z3Z7_9GAMM|nr:MAG: Repeat domain-containing protein [Candidatus Kentron sp. TC]
MKFGYTSRNNPIQETWVAGSKLRKSVHINNISTYIGESLVSTLVPEYTRRDTSLLLTDLEWCDSEGKCIPKVGFIRDSYELPGNFDATNNYTPTSRNWINESGVIRQTGDFNGDGLTDFALSKIGWKSIPIYFSKGDGNFNVTNVYTPTSRNWINESGVIRQTGDFNGDGLTDIALSRNDSWSSIPVYFSKGDGSFDVTNIRTPSGRNWINHSGVVRQTGDYNGDGLTDIALSRNGSWSSIPVYFSKGDGSFDVTNIHTPSGRNWINHSGVIRQTGDYNGDGLTDIALSPCVRIVVR